MSVEFLTGQVYIGKLVGGEASLDSIRSKVGTFNIWPGKCRRTFVTKPRNPIEHLLALCAL